MMYFKKITVFLMVLNFVLIPFNDSLANEVDMNTFPDSYLFDLTNMKPGDWITRDLTIHNNGEKDFIYNTRAFFKGGSEKLYKELLLIIWDSEDQLYEGKLHDFDGLSPRLLKHQRQEDIRFQIKFPWELGNEFQGVNLQFQFKFTAETTTETVVVTLPPEKPPVIPEVTPETPVDPQIPDEEVNPPEKTQLDPPSIEEDLVVPIDPPNKGVNELIDPTAGEDLQVVSENPKDSVEDSLEAPIEIKPERPLDPSEPTDGHILPKTATHMYNYLAGGLTFVMSGGILYLFRRRKKITWLEI